MTEVAWALAVETSVKARRKRLRLTQAELAHRAGLSTTAVHNLEAGKNGFTDKTLAALAGPLNCRPVDLLLPIDVAETPIRGDAAIRAMARRIEGLPADTIEPLVSIITGMIRPNVGSQERTESRGQPEPANHPHE